MRLHRIASATVLPLLSLSLASSTLSVYADQKTTAQLTAASAPGNAEAQYELARAYATGKGVPKDPEKAFQLMKQAAAQDHPDAIGGIGYFYAAGVVVGKDEKEAVEWFRKGTAKGSAKAQLNLGLSVANGRGAPKDEREGLRLIDAAAATSHPDAVYAQAETYFYGQFGRPLDYPKALTIFKSAAEAGNMAAQNTLGVMFRDGLGTERDEKAALEWFRKAAEQGDVRGQSNFGHLLGVESGDRNRRLEALKWVVLAAEQREITAVKTLEELEPNLPPVDIAAARAAAEKFMEKRRAAAQ